MIIKTYSVRSTAAVERVNYFKKGFPSKYGFDNFVTPKKLDLKTYSCLNCFSDLVGVRSSMLRPEIWFLLAVPKMWIDF